MSKKHKLPEYFAHRTSGNEYFSTYKIFKKQQPGKPLECVGLIEDHNYSVTKRYFVGWYFGGKYIDGQPAINTSKIALDTQDDAAYYVFFGEHPEKYLELESNIIL